MLLDPYKVAINFMIYIFIFKAFLYINMLSVVRKSQFGGNDVNKVTKILNC